MKNFRLVVLDYPKLHLEDTVTKTILMDVIVNKQKNFERSDALYVPNDKHDLIGTHFLIYDTTNPFMQKLALGIRLTYEERAMKHKLKLPITDLTQYFDDRLNKAFSDYRKKQPKLVDCSGLFVDQNYSFKNSGLKLIEIAYTMIYFHLFRIGHNHFVGGSNEKYKSSRWIENIGNFPKDLIFVHPMVPDPHMLILIDNFKVEFVKQTYEENQMLFDNIVEFLPEKTNFSSLKESYKSAMIISKVIPIASKLNKVG
jgi:hypothetical protein